MFCRNYGWYPPPAHTSIVFALLDRLRVQVSDSAIGDTDVVTSLRSPQNKL